MKLQAGDSYNVLIAELVRECRERRRWQPVRLVNKERVHYGDKAAAYTNLVAEIAIRVCQQKQIEGAKRVSIRLVCARMDVREEGGSTVPLPVDQYRDRLAEYFAFVAVRHGWAKESADWKVEGPRLGSGTHWRELQICDLISNASHDRFTKCRRGRARCDAAVALKQALGAYDFSLAIRQLVDRVDALLDQNSPAMAAILLSERLTEADGGGEIRDACRNRLKSVIDRLVRIGASARNAQLEFIVSWIEQMIEIQRRLEAGRSLARWLRSEIAEPLKAQVAMVDGEHGLEWFEYSLRHWSLTACNHLGDLRDAAAECESLNRLAPRWHVRGSVAAC